MNIARNKHTGRIDKPEAPLGVRLVLLKAAIAVGVVVLSLPFCAWAQESLEELEERAMKAAVSAVSPSVVRIETVGGLETVEGLLVGTGPTTGLVVSEDGYVISSAFNFAQKPSSILVTLPDGSRASAEIVSRDVNRMLVLLKVKTDQPLTPPKIVPRQEMRVGQWAIAVGRTFEKSRPNVSVGIISAVNRIWGKAIQTDAKISPSNYGGPLIDIRGSVLGILVPMSPEEQDEIAGAEWYDSGIGFAIPMADIGPHLERMKRGEDLKPGLLGISLKNGDIYSLPAELAAVQTKSPAAAAGLKSGDLIRQVDGEPIERQAQLKHALGRRYAGEQISLVVARGSELMTKTLTLTDHLEPYEHAFLGLLPRRDWDAEPGVVVRLVYPGSPAERAGLQPADRLLRIGEAVLTDLGSAHQALASFEPGGRTRILVRRGDQDLEFDVEFAALPSDIPADLPAARDPREPAQERPAVGTIDLKLPEEQNHCLAYVPETYRPDVRYGLLVWLHEPGGFDKDQLLARWKDHCDRADLILLAPQSADPQRWQSTELEFIRKSIDNVLANYQVDRTRIVVHGYQAGGALAYLVAFGHRDLIRGVAPVDALVPIRTSLPENDPVLRLAVYGAASSKSRLAPRIRESFERLRAKKFPVILRETEGYLTDEQIAELVRWIDTLDRI